MMRGSRDTQALEPLHFPQLRKLGLVDDSGYGLRVLKQVSIPNARTLSLDFPYLKSHNIGPGGYDFRHPIKYLRLDAATIPLVDILPCFPSLVTLEIRVDLRSTSLPSLWEGVHRGHCQNLTTLRINEDQEEDLHPLIGLLIELVQALQVEELEVRSPAKTGHDEVRAMLPGTRVVFV